MHSLAMCHMFTDWTKDLCILFLDDQERRHNIIHTKSPHAIHVSTSAKCIEQLSEATWDLVFLDHDLIDGDTGMKVVEWLIHGNIFSKIGTVKRIIVHSTNILMGTEMVQRLTALGFSAFYVPFSFDIGGPFNL